MSENYFEGTTVLEKLVGIGKLDDFYEAVDTDNFNRAKQLMKQAQIDATTIAMVISKMENSEN